MHTIVTYDRKNLKSYHNGELKTTTAATDAIYTNVSLDQFSIGADRSDWTGGDLRGEVALARIWNRGLTPQEVGRLTADPWAIYRKEIFQVGFVAPSATTFKPKVMMF